VLKSLREFVAEFKPVKLTSDQEAAFSDRNVLEFLKENNVRVQFVKDNNHSTLGIIDRFTRTLRDLNTPSEKSKSQSHAEKYRVFTTARMQKLLAIYNNTFHTGIKCTPKEMFEDPELEEEYIFKCIEKQEERERKVKDFELPVGTYVRYILPKHDGITKKRYQVSREYYQIAAREGNMYVLMAKDGNVITRPRFQLLPLKKNEKERMKFADTFPGRWGGVINRVIENVGKRHVRVAFLMPNGEEYIDVVPKSYLK
jgi:hypothetical protein